VYYISNGNIKLANKKFNKLPCDYELLLSNNSTVELCQDGM